MPQVYKIRLSSSHIGLTNHKNRGIKMTHDLKHPPRGWGGVSQTLWFMDRFGGSLWFKRKIGDLGAANVQIIRKMLSKTLKTKGNPSILKLKCQFFLACGAIIVSFINHKVSVVNSRTVWPSDSYSVITKINSECSNHKVSWWISGLFPIVIRASTQWRFKS